MNINLGFLVISKCYAFKLLFFYGLNYLLWESTITYAMTIVVEQMVCNEQMYINFNICIMSFAFLKMANTSAVCATTF